MKHLRKEYHDNQRLEQSLHLKKEDRVEACIISDVTPKRAPS